MRGRIVTAIGAAALACGSLVMAPLAVAAPMSVDDFKAQLIEAMSASGVFAPGTTLTAQMAKVETEGSGAVTGLETVNPDGSLTHYWVESGDVDRVTCLRVNRCWQQRPSVYGDTKWHRLPAGTVTYDTANPTLVMPNDVFDVAGATYDVADVPNVGRVFTLALQGATDSVSLTWTIVGPNMTMVLASPDAQGITREIMRTSFSAQLSPALVTAPAKRVIGVPASSDDATDLSVNINR